MPLIDDAGPTLYFSQPRNAGVIATDAVAIRFRGISGLGKRIANRPIHSSAPAIRHLRL